MTAPLWRGAAPWLLAWVLPVLWTILGAVAIAAAPEASRFRTVASGIGHALLDVRPSDSEPFSVHAFSIDLREAELRLVPAGGPSPRQPVEQIASPFPAVVAVNASFFDKDGRAMGLAVSEGRLLAAGKRASWGALAVSGTDARIVLGSGIADPLAHWLIVQGLPRLVIGGKVPGLKPQIAERTAVCAAGSRVLIVVASKVESAAFARFLAEPPEKAGLGCGDALNLDGGPSTQLVVRLPGLALSLPGWGVPNALVATPGKK
ncbi:MAG: phosphodiester glycosidase family protein [Candidatus Rokuibacteriota bacterium]